jgi:tetratricopeptide (TPR) repeat protein
VLSATPLAPKKEQALAQITQVVGVAEIVRAGDKVGLQARNGDLLFSGDVLSTKAGSATFVFCPPNAKKIEQSIAAYGRAEVKPDAISMKSSVISAPQPAAFCELPIVERNPQTSAKIVFPTDLGPPSTPIDPASLSPSDRQELAQADAALSKDFNNAVARTARAVLLARNGHRQAAAKEYAMLAENRRDLPWAKELVHEYLGPVAPQAQPATGPVYAIVIGISEYGRPSAIPDLHFAHLDAQAFYNFLLSDRGGNIPAANIKLLVNKQATNSAIQEYVKQVLGKPRSKLIFFLSGHGAVSNGEGYLVTYGSDPANLKDSAYPMGALTQLMYGGTPGQVELFIDACRSGHIGSITERNAINHFLLSKSGTVFGMMASREGEVAWEYNGLGEGHGAFTYFLLRALNSKEDYNDGKLTIYDLTHYVEDKVRFLTLKKQTPLEETASVDVNEPFALERDKGIPVERWDGKPMASSLLAVSKGLPLFDVDRPAPRSPGLSQDANLEKLITYENQGQAVLLRYLKGDEISQDRSDFVAGLTAYTEALNLAHDSDYIASRQKFFEGRVAIEDREWKKAREALEMAIRLDPASPSAYNALGISYLEQAQYDEAAAAFDDAIRRAPYWPYPRHNLALAYFQQGQYELATDTYRKAMVIAPDYSYLPYNLGLLFEKINRPREAEESYLKARELARKRAEQARDAASAQEGDAAYQTEARRLGALRVPPAAALSLLSSNQGRRKNARRYYDEAVFLLKQYTDPQQLAMVRHNYAQFLSTLNGAIPEARSLWQQNIDEVNYVPSRISLANSFLAAKPVPDRAGAIAQYQAAVQAETDNVSVRLRLAELLEAENKNAEALPHMIEASRLTPGSILILERLGDLQAALHQVAEARASYDTASALAADSKARERIRSKAVQLK